MKAVENTTLEKSVVGTREVCNQHELRLQNIWNRNFGRFEAKFELCGKLLA